MKQKKSLQAKIVPHALRRRFYDDMRERGREKWAMIAVFWYMFLRSAAGNIFELAEELVIADLGIDKDALRSARNNLVKAGWLNKVRNRAEDGTLLGVVWTVMTEPHPVEAVVEPPPGQPVLVRPAVASTSTGSTAPTVVLHSPYADASTLDCTPSASTSSEGKKETKEGNASLADAREANTPALASLENLSGSGDTADQNLKTSTAIDPWYDQPLEAKVEWCGLPIIKAIETLWYETTSLDDAYNHRELVCHMIYEDSVDTLEYMRLALTECPKTTNIRWRDFPFFAKQWKNVTLPNVIAWDRTRRARMKEKADLSKYGACLLCEYRPAASAAGAYTSQHCTQCASSWSRAGAIRDRCSKQVMEWSYEGGYTYLGTENEEVFVLKKDVDYGVNTKALMNDKRAMDRLEALLNKQAEVATA